VKQDGAMRALRLTACFLWPNDSLYEIYGQGFTKNRALGGNRNQWSQFYKNAAKHLDKSVLR